MKSRCLNFYILRRNDSTWRVRSACLLLAWSVGCGELELVDHSKNFWSKSIELQLLGYSWQTFPFWWGIVCTAWSYRKRHCFESWRKSRFQSRVDSTTWWTKWPSRIRFWPFCIPWWIHFWWFRSIRYTYRFQSWSRSRYAVHLIWGRSYRFHWRLENICWGRLVFCFRFFGPERRFRKDFHFAK